MKTEGGDKMSFWGHLEVLRWTLVRVLAALLLLFCVSFAIIPKIFDSVILSAAVKAGVEIINVNVTAPFFTHMSTAFWISLVLVFPYAVFELWRFLLPALYKDERRGVKAGMFGVTILFYLGCAVGYFVIFPMTFHFLAGYHIADSVPSQVSLNSYISTFLSIIFIMGLVFELPILAKLLSVVGVIDKSFLKKNRKIAVIVLLILAAVITPTGDPFTLSVVFLPVYLLYEFSILIVK